MIRKKSMLSCILYWGWKRDIHKQIDIMIGQMAIAAGLPGYNDLGRSVTPTFFTETDFIHN